LPPKYFSVCPKNRITQVRIAIDWLAEWRHLASITYGIQTGDPRLPAILHALDHCDAAFLSGDVARFKAAAEQIEKVVNADER
jgi:hypothetical protein